ncbi:hypothetical protein RB620_17175 [Paenibacillus sp. LHD-117]|uniref:hypothetical protein n=1 Tax=Paenibacillus sp. LHD-117 TaxID=3071412 RepID=UPI0027DF51E6|nr:hypothetical protein [Paenibacillus sp. LHD-117]MDQ6421158.1 hypothetical protein [Paenibacillus sp. LHD-117]
MTEQNQAEEKNLQAQAAEPHYEGRETYDMDIDRMVNEGLGGGNVSMQNGLIAESTTDTMTSEWEGKE